METQPRHHRTYLKTKNPNNGDRPSSERRSILAFIPNPHPGLERRLSQLAPHARALIPLQAAVHVEPRTMALLRAAVLASIGAVTSQESEDRLQRISALKATIHAMSYVEAEQALRALASTAPRERQRQSRIDHFVVLYQENHGFDHMLGCLQSRMPGLDGIPAGGRAVWINASNHSQGFVNVSCGNASYVCESGPTYSLFAGRLSMPCAPVDNAMNAQVSSPMVPDRSADITRTTIRATITPLQIWVRTWIRRSPCIRQSNCR